MWTFRILIAALCLIVLILAIPRALSQDLRAGQQIASKHCARCHAIGTSGASPLTKAPPFRTIANQYSVWSLQESLAEGIVTGHLAMPEFKFEPDQIADLLTFMDTFTKPKAKSQ